MTNSKNKDLSGLATPTTDLPDGWVEIELGTLFEFEYGKGLTKKQRNEYGEVPVYGSNGIVGHHDDFLVEGPVLIVGRKGAAGEVAISTVACWPIDTTYFVKVSDNLSLEFSYYLLKSLRLDQFDRSTAIPGLNRNDAYRLRILLPPLAEQHRIVAKIEELFSDLDHSIAALEQSREQLKIYRQAVLKYAFEGKLTEGWRAARGQDPKGCGRETSGENLLGLIQAERETRTQQQLADWQAAVTAWESQGRKGRKPAKPKKPKALPPLTEAELAELPGLPEGWVYNYLAYTGELARGKSKHRPRNDKILYGGDYPFIQTGEVKAANGVIRTYSQTYNEVGLSQSKLWPEGTLCITIAANIAETAFLGFDACFPDSIVGFSGFKDIVEPTYVDYFIQSVQQRIEAFAPATAQKNINLTILENLLIPFCPLEEQHAIVSEIEARLSVVDNMEQTIAAALQQAEALRQSILKQAFAGKLVPQESADEPAAALLERIQNPKGF